MNERKDTAGDPPQRSPFHEGERRVQSRVGVRVRMEEVGRHIFRDSMPDEHRAFVADLPFVLLGTLDDQAPPQPWASILIGPPGFMTSPEPRTLRIAARPILGDALAARARVGARVGVLAIEPATRSRIRLNGTVVGREEDLFVIAVEQSFGNCPKYIQTRFVEGRLPDRPSGATTASEGATLSARAIKIVRAADTFFIASAADGACAAPADPALGVDVSHRGGKPGFVRASTGSPGDHGTILTFPDFMGNFLFNTLGNLETNPRAGLLFVDFASGDVLTLAGKTKVIWGGAEVDAFARAQRLVEVHVHGGRHLPKAIPWRWSAPGLARELPATGAWPRD